MITNLTGVKKMSNVIFKVTKGEKWNPDFGALDVLKVISLVGLTPTSEKPSYGRLYALFNDYKVEVRKSNKVDRIEISANWHYSDRIDIKELTAKKIENIRKKIQSWSDEDKARDNRQQRRQELYEKLSALGLTYICYDSFYFKEIGFDVSPLSGEIRSRVTISGYYLEKYVSADREDFLNALEITKRDIAKTKIVCSGAGAASIAIAKLFINMFTNCF